MIKSHKIRSAYLVVNCVGLRTFWMPLVHLYWLNKLNDDDDDDDEVKLAAVRTVPIASGWERVQRQWETRCKGRRGPGSTVIQVRRYVSGRPTSYSLATRTSCSRRTHGMRRRRLSELRRPCRPADVTTPKSSDTHRHKYKDRQTDREKERERERER